MSPSTMIYRSLPRMDWFAKATVEISFTYLFLKMFDGLRREGNEEKSHGQSKNDIWCGQMPDLTKVDVRRLVGSAIECEYISRLGRVCKLLWQIFKLDTGKESTCCWNDLQKNLTGNCQTKVFCGGKKESKLTTKFIKIASRLCITF